MKITAVVVTYNRVELLKECIVALQSQNELDGIIVVDNNSTDNTRSYLNELKINSKIKIHTYHLPENTGGAGGFHVGLEKACQLEYDYAWIMDDDAIPQDSSLFYLVDATSSLGDDFGFLASSVKDVEGVCMNTPTIDLSPNVTGYADWAENMDKGYLKISMATFVSVFIKTETIREVGLPVKEMFIWGDDSEFTQRVSKKYPSYFVPKSNVIHKRVMNNELSIITEENAVRLNWYKFLYRNNGYRIKSHESKKSLVKYLFASILRSISIIFKAKNRRLLRLKILFGGLLGFIIFNPAIKKP